MTYVSICLKENFSKRKQHVQCESIDVHIGNFSCKSVANVEKTREYVLAVSWLAHVIELLIATWRE